jgi:hypothetical protein
MSAKTGLRDFINGTSLEILDIGIGMRLDLTPDDALTPEQRDSGKALRADFLKACESWTEGTRDAHMALVRPEWEAAAKAWLAATHGIRLTLARQA